MHPTRRLLVLLSLFTLTVACAVPNPAAVPALQILPNTSSASGKLLFVKDGNVWTWTDSGARQLTTGETWRQPQWSPDGSEIAYVYRSTNFSELFVMNADGSNSRRLTRSQSTSLADNDWAFRPNWSPDGEQIAFVTDSSTYNATLWLMKKDGSGKKQLLPIAAGQEAADSSSWAPDGKRLAVTSFGQGFSQILLVDVARGVAQPFTDHPRGALDPAWSPDGNAIAYAAREGARVDIRIKRLDGSAELGATRDGLARAPVWSPDGKQLAYVSLKSGSFEVHALEVLSEGPRLAVQNDRQLTRDLNVDAASGLSWSR